MPTGTRANYHPAYDRSAAAVGTDVWDLRAPNGAVDIGDIARSATQFGDRCTGPEIEGTWSNGTPMPTARTEVTGATLDGVIYVAGGFVSNGTHVALVEAYDTAGDAWLSPSPAPLPQALDHAGAAAVNGKVYVVGGYSVFPSTISAATYEYDPAINLWTERAPMPLARAAAATVELGGKVYVMGGVGPQPAVPLVYDPAMNIWSQLAPMSAAREHLTAAAVGGKIYVIGGRQNLVQNVNIAEVYDPAPNTWAPPLTVLPTARGGLASGVLNGRIHVVGGENLASGGGTYPQHEAYDIGANWWIPSLPIVTPRHGLLAQAVDGKLYVIGGGPTPNLSVSNLVEIFELKP
jgi:N-acetylneuraminic acid mutarotase